MSRKRIVGRPKAYLKLDGERIARLYPAICVIAPTDDPNVRQVVSEHRDPRFNQEKTDQALNAALPEANSPTMAEGKE